MWMYLKNDNVPQGYHGIMGSDRNGYESDLTNLSTYSQWKTYQLSSNFC